MSHVQAYDMPATNSMHQNVDQIKVTNSSYQVMRQTREIADNLFLIIHG
jgi:citrate lyase alpha subunit